MDIMSEITFPPPIEHKTELFTKLQTNEFNGDESFNTCEDVQKMHSNKVDHLESTENFSNYKTDIEVNDSFYTTNGDTNNSLKSELYFYSLNQIVL